MQHELQMAPESLACTSSERTVWKAGKSMLSSVSTVCLLPAAVLAISAATLSNRKWLKPGTVGFLQTARSNFDSWSKHCGATGAICAINQALEEGIVIRFAVQDRADAPPKLRNAPDPVGLRF